MVFARTLLKLGTRLYFAFVLLGIAACVYALIYPPADVNRFYTLVVLFSAAPAVIIYISTRLLAWVFSPDDRPVKQSRLAYFAMFLFAIVFSGFALVPFYFES